MRFHALFLLLLLCCVYLAAAQGKTSRLNYLYAVKRRKIKPVSYDDCCLKYVRKMSRGAQKHAVSYKVQKADGSCNIAALIFIMKRGRMICANPSDSWALRLVESIDAKKAKQNSKYYKKPRPLQRKG
ncbi:C-C motif chemokine 25 [Oryzias melastigma]|uniref:C-C motif chemokine 25 n=1 Tax=Oryzias melastigma TaxID=30732 RepID=A0A834KW53_ORYME|nr:C-C motif chemokine 25 [Oryzias melastigma]